MITMFEVIRGPTKNKDIRMLETMVSGIPFVFGLRTRM